MAGNATVRAPSSPATRNGVRVARGEQRSRLLVVAVDRADGVDHPSGIQCASRGRHRSPGRKALGPFGFADLPALLEDRGTAAAMDRTVHPAAAQETGVRGVHDRVDVLFGDVALEENDPGHAGIVGR